MKISVLAENSAGRSHARECLAEWAEQSLDLAADFDVVASKEPVEFSPGIFYFGDGFLYPMHCVDHDAMSAFYDNFKVRKYGAGDIFEVETIEG